MRKLLLVSVLSLICETEAIAEFQLPFEGGLTLNVTRSYNTASTHLNKDYFALDFVGSGCSSWNSPVLAVNNGVVIEVHDKNDNAYGRYIVIDHGNGICSKYAHLNSISVSINEAVKSGQEIGRMGNTGNVFGQACVSYPGTHLHFVVYSNNQAYRPEPISGYTSLSAGSIYTSLNTYNSYNNFRVGKYSDGYVLENTSDARPFSRPFAVTYYHNQGVAMLGYPVSSVYRMDNCIGCNNYGAEHVYVQDFFDGACGSATLVMNMLTWNIRFGYLGVVYPIHGQMRDYWNIHFSELGAPVSNEYSWNGKVVQWFEPSDNNYIAVVYDANTQTFQQCSTCTVDCPPLVEADGTDRIKQALWDNLGCPNNDCGVGGDGTEASLTTNPDYTFTDATICQTVTNGVPDGKDYAFYPEDGYVGIWFELNDVYNSLNISWKWYKPSGEFYGECNHITDTPPDGHLSKLKAWHFLNISEMTDYGTWRIELYVNGSKVDTQFFSLNIPDDDPAAVPVVTITAPQNFNILTVE